MHHHSIKVYSLDVALLRRFLLQEYPMTDFGRVSEETKSTPEVRVELEDDFLDQYKI
jgi:hypothetical protein